MFMLNILLLPFLFTSITSTSKKYHFRRPQECLPGFNPCSKKEHLEVNSFNCQLTCENKDYLSPSSVCAPFTGCVCNVGYVRLFRNASGPCITEFECPPPPIYCGRFEEPTDCENRCPPQTCDRLFMSYRCHKKKRCRPGCKCIKGFLRNDIGMCIPKRFCPAPFFFYRVSHLIPHRKVTFPNGWESPKSSATKSDISSPSSAIIPAPSWPKTSSSPSTRLISDFRVDGCNVSTSNPMTVTCEGPNEVWHICPPVCLFENCDDLDCPPYLLVCTKKQKCIPRCICKENFYRNASNVCIPADDCPYYDIE